MIDEFKTMWKLIRYGHCLWGYVIGALLLWIISLFILVRLNDYITGCFFASCTVMLLNQMFYQMEYASFFAAAPKKGVAKMVDRVSVAGNFINYLIFAAICYGRYSHHPGGNEFKVNIMLIALTLFLFQLFTGISMKCYLLALGSLSLTWIFVLWFIALCSLREGGFINFLPTWIICMGGGILLLLSYYPLWGIRKLTEKIPISHYSVGRTLYKKMNT